MALSFTGKSILVADDSDVNRMLAAEVLASKDMLVSTVENGKEALEFVQQQSVDMILMDIEMPVMDGLVATRKIRALGEAYDRLPIIAMTAADTDEDKAMGVKAGMNDYLTKPLEPESMFLVAQKWLSEFDEIVGEPDHSELEHNHSGTLPQIDAFDFVSALRRTRGNESLLITMLDSFVNTYREADSELSLLLAEKKYIEAERLLHQIKGSGANLGLIGLSAVAGDIEGELKRYSHSVRASSLVSADNKLEENIELSQKNLEAFSHSVCVMNKQLAKVLQSDIPVEPSSPLSSVSINSVQVSNDELVQYLEKIQQYLSCDLGQVKPAIEALKKLSMNTVYQARAEELELAFNRFDMGALSELVDDWISE